MRRQAFHVLAGLSLILCMAVAALWVRSYWVSDQWYDSAFFADDSDIWITHEQVHFYFSDRGTLLLGAAHDRHPGPLARRLSVLPAGFSHYTYPIISTVPFDSTRQRLPYSVPVYLRGGWGWTRHSSGSSGFTAVAFPCWLACLLTGVLPAFMLPTWWVNWQFWRQRHLRHRQLHNLCLTCGYNLTGNLSGVCPECGTLVPAQVGGNTP